MTKAKKTALVTGASSGIGYELARLFAKDSINLVLVARNKLKLDLAAIELYKINPDISITVIPKDLSVVDSAKELYDHTSLLGIEINYLVNDAGIGQRGFFWETSFEKDLEIINLNIISLVHLTKLYLNDMLLRNEGRILQLASIAAYQPTPLLSVYAASKAFVLSFGDALVNELQDTNITLTSLIPGPTNTDFFNKAEASETLAAHKTDEAAKVAKVGYDAMFKGEHHAVATPAVSTQVAMSSILPNDTVAKMARKYMEEDK